ncbi:MAG: OmpA family protein [Shimia sp.]
MMFRLAIVLWALGASMAVGEVQGADPCHQSVGLRPAQCPIDDRIALLDMGTRDDHVFFVGGGTRLDAYAERRLLLLARLLESAPFGGTCLLLQGHSDSVGPEDANDRLALRRAERVRDYLSAAMADAAPRIEVISAGESSPLPDAAADAPIQRRVTIHARDCPV